MPDQKPKLKEKPPLVCVRVRECSECASTLVALCVQSELDGKIFTDVLCEEHLDSTGFAVFGPPKDMRDLLEI